ncbi:MAG TPA: amidohydrolase [Gemmatimonadales bacterium]|nr:amidohydrolase [Gemmatimonadales bacterium]
MPRSVLPVTTACVMLLAPSLQAQDAKQLVMRHVEQHQARYVATAQRIWDLAEVGYQERESSALLQGHLREAGFDVKAGVAGIPTAFVASFGSGKPVIAILAEFDALPGITQSRSPEREPVSAKPAGHACGHHLFGTASTAAALAVKDWLATGRRTGTIRLYGTPAEEGGSGKVYMVRAGLFDDVDVVLHWHAGDANSADAVSSLANKSAKFRFRGLSAHAAAAPERGRSALDGVEAMNHMVNLMREHVPAASRIHYVITSGGSAPNVVPDFAEVYYYVRHPDPEMVRSIFDRVVQAAEGAALGTGTEVTHEVIGGVYNLLPIASLAEMMHANLTAVGGVTYTAQERAFAEVLRRSLPADVPPIEAAGTIKPLEVILGARQGGGSTDVGDVSWVVPTVGLRVATWVPGTASHSWQAIAAGGTTIGEKGMMVAAKTLARSAVDLFLTPALVTRARAEFEQRRGPNYRYVSLVGDRAPPLDYRNAPGNN